MASKETRRRAIAAYGMLAPTLLLFAVFILLPMVLAIVIAFKQVDISAGIVASPWVGLDNFNELFGSIILSERIKKAFLNTLLYTICFVPVNIVVSLVIATLIHSVQERAQSFYRAAFYLPTVTSAIVFAMIWKWLYDTNYGLLNYALSFAGLGPINWTGDPDWAMWSIIIAALGVGPGANVLIFLAALGSVPEETLEAAEVDGANALERWWNVTVPAIKPVTLYLIVLNTIGSFQVFELVFVLTSGGPAGSSTVLVYEIYNLAFGQGRYGTAGALALILLVIVTCFTILQFTVFGKDATVTRKPGRIDKAMEFAGDRIGDMLGVIGGWFERIMIALRGPAIRRQQTSPFKSAPSHIVLFPLACLFLFPMAWMFLSAFTPSVYLQSMPPRVAPAHFSLDNYKTLYDSAPDILWWFWNSLYLSVFIMAAQLLLSCLAGYVFARILFPGRKIIFALFIASIILPYQALVIPLFIVMSSGIRNILHIELLNTHWAIILPGLCSPVGIFLLKQFIESLPKELEEAARIDGCGEFGIWWRVILPLCKPILGAWGILSFTGAWRNFFWPFVVLGSEKLFTLEVGLQTLQQQNVSDFGLIMAGATTSAVPMIIIFFIFQRQIVRGLTFGAVKG